MVSRAVALRAALYERAQTLQLLKVPLACEPVDMSLFTTGGTSPVGLADPGTSISHHCALEPAGHMLQAAAMVQVLQCLTELTGTPQFHSNDGFVGFAILWLVTQQALLNISYMTMHLLHTSSTGASVKTLALTRD